MPHITRTLILHAGQTILTGGAYSGLHGEKLCLQTCQLVIAKHSDDEYILINQQNQPSSEQLNLERCAYVECMQTCQDEVA